MAERRCWKKKTSKNQTKPFGSDSVMLGCLACSVSFRQKGDEKTTKGKKDAKTLSDEGSGE
jgi:hypothetical protein